MKKNLLPAILKITAFFIIANLPFLTVAHLIGIDTFIDSFNHPTTYSYLKNQDIHLMNPSIRYIILEKPSHQAPVIKEGDSILCHTIKDNIQQRMVSQIQTKQGITIYYTTSSTDSSNTQVYDSQIIGKIVGTSEDNLWYTLCLQFWELSREKLNIFTLFAVQ
jgi:hypothetical protein